MITSGGERLIIALMICVVICFLSFLFVGQKPPETIIGVPYGPESWQRTSAPDVPRGTDVRIYHQDPKPPIVRENGLSEVTVP